jgi:hypothetical protein
MKQSLALLGCAILLLVFSGCQQLGRSNSNADVIVEGGGKFPKSLAGTWEANNKNDLNYWKIVFEPDGKVSSAILPLGEVEVKPNRTTEAKGPKGESGFYEAGDFTVDYKPQGRELAVNIEIKQFYLERLIEWNVILKGSWEYFVAGNISEDGKTWQANVFSSPDMVVLVPDPNHIEDKSKFKETAKLHINLGNGEGEQVIFTKVPDGNTVRN